jgi:dTDP-4-amino-4,6-dideoxygalactose transaminase
VSKVFGFTGYNRRFFERQFPVTRRINEKGFYIGCHQHMGDSEIARIHDAFTTYFA